MSVMQVVYNQYGDCPVNINSSVFKELLFLFFRCESPRRRKLFSIVPQSIFSGKISSAQTCAEDAFSESYFPHLYSTRTTFHEPSLRRSTIFPFPRINSTASAEQKVLNARQHQVILFPVFVPWFHYGSSITSGLRPGRSFSIISTSSQEQAVSSSLMILTVTVLNTFVSE